MADVRSSSALVAELTQLLPSEMTLDSFQIEGSRLSIDGTVLEPNGLRTINTFLLQLGQSACLTRSWCTGESRPEFHQRG